MNHQGRGGKTAKSKLKLNKNLKNNNLKFIQINTQHGKSATNDLVLFAKKFTSPIIMVQEPYVNNTNTVLKPVADIFVTAKYDQAHQTRACIFYHKSLDQNIWFMDSLSTPDCATIQTKINNEPIIISSCYMDGNEKTCPPPILKKVVDYAKVNKLAFMAGSDVNAHNTVWHSKMGDNHRAARGDQLLDFINNNNLIIENVGDEPTFDNGRWKNIIDLTITNAKGHALLDKWQVITNEVNASDHKFITYNLKSKDPVGKTKFRDVAKTNWPLYQDKLGNIMVESASSFTNINSTEKVDSAAVKLAESVQTAYNEATEEIYVSNKIKSPPWETKEVRQARSDIRHRLRKARNTKSDKDWTELRSHQAEYRRLVNHTKTLKFKDFCAKLEAKSSGKRISNILKDEKTTKLGTVRDQHGRLTESPEETLKVLEETHFKTQHPTSPRPPPRPGEPLETGNNIEPSLIFSKRRVKKALMEFDPLSAAGPDGIRPIMLQKGWDMIEEAFTNIAKASLSLAHTPKCWSDSTGIFIPKPGKSDYYNPKSYRTITLAPTMLKWMERVILWHMEADLKVHKSMNAKQYGFTKGVSTETALHKLVNKLETAILHEGMALCTFLDIEGAFDNVSFSAIKRALNRKCTSSQVNSWIMNMIQNRTTNVELNGIKKRIKITRGCPQGGILSPFLWNLVVDSLLSYTKHKIPCDLQGFADDLCLTATLNSKPSRDNMGLNENNLKEHTQTSLTAINGWCKENGLTLSALKTHAVMFTWNRKWKLSSPLVVDGEEIEMKESTKILGITIDSKLTWNEHISIITKKAKNTLMLCKKVIGATWGITPKTMKWIYTAIVRPRISYAAAIWINGTKTTNNQKQLEGVQRLATKLISGGMPSTPKTALDKITNVTPILLWLEEEAIKGALRLQTGNHWDHEPPIPSRGKLQSHIKTLNNLIKSIPSLNSEKDAMITSLNLDTNFNIEIPEKESYTEPIKAEDAINCYTDGSMTDDKTGTGVHIEQNGVTIHEEAFHIETPSSVFQAEMFGIQEATEFLLKKDTKNSIITINSDSQAAIKATDCLNIKSKTTWNTIENLNKLGTNNQVTVRWIPSHSDYSGNERADTLAKQGADNSEATVVRLPTPGCCIKAAIKNRTNQTWELNRTKEPNSFFKQMWREKFAKDIDKLNKKNLRIATHILTGHAALNYHLNKYKPTKIKKACPHCSDADETITHYLGKCSKWSYQRFFNFGMFYMDPDKIANTSTLQQIIKFANSTKRLKFDPTTLKN